MKLFIYFSTRQLGVLVLAIVEAFETGPCDKVTLIF
jgi:hypothetical protein